MVANQKWHPVSWRPDILARRVCNWLTYAEFISAGADGDFAEKFLDNIARQIRHLRRAGRFVPNGVDRMLVTKSLIYAALCLPTASRFVPRQIKAVARMSRTPGFAGRRPHGTKSDVSQMQALRHLIDIQSVLGTSSIEIPEALAARDRPRPHCGSIGMEMAEFALFNGSTESEPRLIDVVLTKAEARGKPLMSSRISASSVSP